MAGAGRLGSWAGGGRSAAVVGAAVVAVVVVVVVVTGWEDVDGTEPGGG